MLSLIPSFDDVFASFDNLFNDARFSYNEPFPPKNVFFCEDGTCEITLALAGYCKDELTVSVDNGKIIVTGKPRKEVEKKGQYFNGRKIKKAEFEKKYALDTQIPYDYDNITVTFENGLLDIVIPCKKEKVESTRTIAIQ